jgi:hypothetical protein
MVDENTPKYTKKKNHKKNTVKIILCKKYTHKSYALNINSMRLNKHIYIFLSQFINIYSILCSQVLELWILTIYDKNNA